MRIGTDTLSRALSEAACETLENLAFTELASEADAGLPAGGPRACARIALGADGHLAIALSRPLLAGIASILFGLEEDGLDEPTLSDTLLEIANIIAGRFLQKVHGARSDFILGLPSAFGDEAAWDRFPVRLAFSAGPGRALAVGLSPGAGT